MADGLTRRAMLRLGVGVVCAGVAGGLALKPWEEAEGRRRRPGPGPGPRSGRIGDIDHVVILMQENRSFDHYFGTYPGVSASVTRRYSSRAADGQRGQDGAPFRRRRTDACPTRPTTGAPQHASGTRARWTVRARTGAAGIPGSASSRWATRRVGSPLLPGLAGLHALRPLLRAVIGPADPNRLMSLSRVARPGRHARRAADRRRHPTEPTALRLDDHAQAAGGPRRGMAHLQRPRARRLHQRPLRVRRDPPSPPAGGRRVAPVPARLLRRRARRCAAAGQLGVRAEWSRATSRRSRWHAGQAMVAEVLQGADGGRAALGPHRRFVTWDEAEASRPRDRLDRSRAGTAATSWRARACPSTPEGARTVGPACGVGLLVVSPFSRAASSCSEVFDQLDPRSSRRRLEAEVPHLSRWRREATAT